MLKNCASLSTILAVLALCGCSINTASSSVATVLPTSPSQSIYTPSSGANAGTSSALGGTTVPITWGDLNLTGKLVYNAAFTQNEHLLANIQILDLTTGVVSTVFTAPSGGWVDAVAVSPDGKELLLSYTPPVSASSYGGQDTLYILPRDGSQTPRLLFPPPSADDRYYQPEWSPDGKYVYFAQYNYKTATIYSLMRMAYPGGNLEKVADNAYWPRTSGDGASLVYVSPAFGVNQLFVSNPDGSDARQISLTGPYVPKIIDSPMFLASDRSILFSAPVTGQSSTPGWVDRLFGITIASADGSIPSDWWSIPLAGGIPQRLTHLHSPGLFARFSPDKKHVIFYSAQGILVMNPDGTGLTQVISYTGGQSGTVNWIP